MEKTWRWSGKKDEITLPMLRQIGVEGIVTALYDIPAGEVWAQETVTELSDFIKEAGMRWSVVDNLPVNEIIMLGGEDTDKLIDNYIQNLANLGEEGINTVCYNFIPIIHNGLSANENTSTSHIPLKENLKYFLSQLMPVCEEYNLNMCITPQSSELNRFTNDVEDLEWILKAVDNPYNGFALTIESLSSDIMQSAKKFASRIRFIHLLNTNILTLGNKSETPYREEREHLIDLVHIFEKTNPFMPICIDHCRDVINSESNIRNPDYSFQSHIHALAKLDGVIATVQDEIGQIK